MPPPRPLPKALWDRSGPSPAPFPTKDQVWNDHTRKDGTLPPPLVPLLLHDCIIRWEAWPVCLLLEGFLLSVYILYVHFFCRCQLYDFHAPTDKDGTHPRLFEWVKNYFHSSTDDFRPPLYLQHQGLYFHKSSYFASTVQNWWTRNHRYNCSQTFEKICPTRKSSCKNCSAHEGWFEKLQINSVHW